MESDDPLEAGLEIVARPPGKKPQTMTLLSGGEQALTAMALIFAVFLTNPAPICVLDEVDAPLDDHNVERFCNLMDEMSRETDTRFVIITHNPITMARMDRLFGVTMAEQGGRQLVSVDLQVRAEVLAPERGLHVTSLEQQRARQGAQFVGRDLAQLRAAAASAFPSSRSGREQVEGCISDEPASTPRDPRAVQQQDPRTRQDRAPGTGFQMLSELEPGFLLDQLLERAENATRAARWMRGARSNISAFGFVHVARDHRVARAFERMLAARGGSGIAPVTAAARVPIAASPPRPWTDPAPLWTMLATSRARGFAELAGVRGRHGIVAGGRLHDQRRALGPRH